MGWVAGNIQIAKQQLLEHAHSAECEVVGIAIRQCLIAHLLILNLGHRFRHRVEEVHGKLPFTGELLESQNIVGRHRGGICAICRLRIVYL